MCAGHVIMIRNWFKFSVPSYSPFGPANSPQIFITLSIFPGFPAVFCNQYKE